MTTTSSSRQRFVTATYFQSVVALALLQLVGCGSNADKMTKPPAASGASEAPKPAASDSVAPKSPTAQQPAAPPTEPAPGPTLVPPTNEPRNETPPPNDASSVESPDVNEQSSKVDGDASKNSATPASESSEQLVNDEAPQQRTAFFRAAEVPAAIARVLPSKADESMCLVRVGDAMPAIKLPQLDGEGEIQLSDKFGEKATVIVFWKGDRRMAQQELADLGPDVVEPFRKMGVEVVGIAVNEKADTAQAALKKSGAGFLNLLDADGKAFAQVGKERLPRTYLLDSKGKILWFDIEYSPATRRELHQALRAVAGTPAAAAADKPTLGRASGEPAPAGDTNK
jgi:peroxiredoxin